MAGVIFISTLSLSAHADSFEDLIWNNVIKGTTISGYFGIAHKWRLHNGNGDTKALRTDYGLDLKIHTGALYGFSAGFSHDGSHQLVSYPASKDTGFGKNLDEVDDLFLQYQGWGSQFRAGRQTINTPFAATDEFTLMPRAFMGGAVDISLFNTPIFTNSPSVNNADYVTSMDSIYDNTFDDTAPIGRPDAQIYLGKFTKFSGRFDDKFAHGTDEYGTAGAGSLGEDGFVIAGLQYRQSLAAGNVMSRGWFYNFRGAAQLAYYEAGYQVPALGLAGIRPYVRAQFINETGAGSALDQLGNGTVDRVNSTFYGVRLGVQAGVDNLDMSAIFAYQPSRPGTFHNGGLYHPYSDLSGTLYDDMMNAGIENTGPGKSYGIRVTANITAHLSGLFGVIYYTSTYGTGGNYYQYTGYQGFAQNGAAPGSTHFVHDEQGHEVDATLSYDLVGINPALKNFTIKDAFGVTYWNGAALFIANRHHKFGDNRIYLTYSF